MHFFIKANLLFFAFINPCYAKIVNYDITIDYKAVVFNGDNTKAMSVNNSIPAPTLYFTEGDSAHILVSNAMNVATSVHWHGILLPNHQDGVPYVNHAPIAAGESHLFSFKIKQSGTYWYHSHTGLQEQRGVYGAIVIAQKNAATIAIDKEVTLVLSDWINENPDAVLRTLKSGSDYYSVKKGSQQNLLSAIQQGGFTTFFNQAFNRMPRMDISDIVYDEFLVNGEAETIISAKPGKLLKLRLVNASAATYYTLEFAQADMQIIAADGIDVEPLTINRFLMAVAETYTLLIKVPKQGLHELRATAQDGSGYSSIWIGSGNKIPAPDSPKPNPYQMSTPMDSMADMAHHDHNNHQNMVGRADTPYQKLTALLPTTLPAENKLREIKLDLTGDMERYIWSINNEILSEDNSIKIKRGENIRFILTNKTMMHHPMHLHGHFFRVINGKGDYSPLKHTIDVPPMDTRIIEFEANERQDWFFHCHILYHAKSGMARVISYQDDSLDPELANIRHELYRDEYFFYGNGSFLSQMTEGLAVFSNSKNSLHTDWQVGWQNVDATEYEFNITYERYVNRFLSGFAGLRFEHDIERGIFGWRYLLPLNFESEWRVDTAGELRISLENSLALSNNLSLLVDFEYDTESQEEWSVGLHYLFNKNLGIITQYHSGFGIGAGINLAF